MRKKRAERHEKSGAERFAEILDIPKDVVFNLPRLIFTGNRELFIENYRGIVEYSDTLIRLNTSECMIKITGVELGIKNIATEEITVYGRIKILEFL